MPNRRPSAVKSSADEPAPLEAAENAPLVPRELRPIVVGAFAVGLLLGTRPGRHVVRGAVRTALILVKPALLAGGLLKLRELADRPSSVPQSPLPPP
jgi:hypothetical protein